MASVRADGEPANIGLLEEGQGLMGATPWDARDRYIENSPSFFYDRVTRPLLVMTGALDKATPPSFGEEIVVSLKRLGKTVRYAKYLRGEHTEESLDRVDALDYFARVMAWFDTHLKVERP